MGGHNFIPALVLGLMPVNYCYVAMTCIHDNRPVCASTPDGCSRRTFLDQCDMYEFNCDYNTNYRESYILHCMTSLEASVRTSPVTTPKPITKISNTLEEITFTEENIIEDSPTSSSSTTTCVSTSLTQKLCACLCHSKTPKKNPPTSASTTTSIITMLISSPTNTTTPTKIAARATTTTNTPLTTTPVLRTTATSPSTITNPTTTTIWSTPKVTNPSSSSYPTTTTTQSCTTSTSPITIIYPTTTTIKIITTNTSQITSSTKTTTTSHPTTQMRPSTTKLIKKSTLKTAETTTFATVITKPTGTTKTSPTPTNTESKSTTKKTTVCINCQRPTIWETTTEKDLPYIFITTPLGTTEPPTQKTLSTIQTTIKDPIETVNIQATKEDPPETTLKYEITSFDDTTSAEKTALYITTEEYIQNTVVSKEVEFYDPTSDRGFILKENYEEILVLATDEEIDKIRLKNALSSTTAQIIRSTPDPDKLLNITTWWYPTPCKFENCERPVTWLTTRLRRPWQRNNY